MGTALKTAQIPSSQELRHDRAAHRHPTGLRASQRLPERRADLAAAPSPSTSHTSSPRYPTPSQLTRSRPDSIHHVRASKRTPFHGSSPPPPPPRHGAHVQPQRHRQRPTPDAPVHAHPASKPPHPSPPSAPPRRRRKRHTRKAPAARGSHADEVHPATPAPFRRARRVCPYSPRAAPGLQATRDGATATPSPPSLLAQRRPGWGSSNNHRATTTPRHDNPWVATPPRAVRARRRSTHPELAAVTALARASHRCTDTPPQAPRHRRAQRLPWSQRGLEQHRSLLRRRHRSCLDPPPRRWRSRDPT
jgi:hypothetical protein